MSIQARGPAPSRSRGVHYYFEAPRDEDVEFMESDMEALLKKACEAGTITQFDTGRGRIVWFEGTPGAALRELRRKVVAMLPASFTTLRRP